MAEETREKREARWWREWFAADYSWAGLVSKDIPGGGQFGEETLQDYWRRDPGTGRRRSDAALKKAGELVEFDNRWWHLAHLPPRSRGGVKSWKADLKAPDWVGLEQLIAARIAVATETPGVFGHEDEMQRRLRSESLDGRVQLDGAALGSDLLHPEAELSPLHLSCPNVAFLGDINFGRVAFGAGVDFTDATFFRDVSYDRAIFAGDVHFDDAIFCGTASFDDVIFSGYTSFGGATFFGYMGFDNATFSDKVAFLRTAFHHASFFSATFTREARFEIATFSDSARFDKATFSGEVRFSGTEFPKDVSFDGATFSGGVFFGSNFFGGVTFSGEASFDNAIFAGIATFDSVTFSRYASFDAAIFSSDARFDRTTFSDVSFDSTIFKASAFIAGIFAAKGRFHNAVFEGSVRFSAIIAEPERNFASAFYAARFMAIADFSGAAGQGQGGRLAAAFVETQFEKALILTDGPDSAAREYFRDRMLPGARASGDEGLRQLEAGCRTIKVAMGKARDEQREQRYYRFQLSARQAQTDIDRWEKVFGGLYQFASDFGSSLWRPLATLVVMTVAFGLAYWAGMGLLARGNVASLLCPAALTGLFALYWRNAARAGADAVGLVWLAGSFAGIVLLVSYLLGGDAVWHGQSFALSAVFRPFFLFSLEGVPQAKSWSEGVKFAVRLVTACQSILSGVLIFLFALAVKRRFQIS